MNHTVKFEDQDEVVIVTRSGEEMHLPTRQLADLMDAARMGNDMLRDDAHDEADDTPEFEDRIATCNEVEDHLEWIEARTMVELMSTT